MDRLNSKGVDQLRTSLTVRTVCIFILKVRQSIFNWKKWLAKLLQIKFYCGAYFAEKVNKQLYGQKIILQKLQYNHHICIFILKVRQSIFNWKKKWLAKLLQIKFCYGAYFAEKSNKQLYGQTIISRVWFAQKLY